MSEARHVVNLNGCAPTPLAQYLKALGVLRIVAEQTDASATGWWKNASFWLESKLDEESLLAFFIQSYVPSSIVVPWSGGDFFNADRAPSFSEFHKKWPITSGKDRPKGETVIEAVLASTSARFAPYREVIETVFLAMENAGVARKEDLDATKGKRKPLLLASLRNVVPDELIPWLDVACIVGDLSTQDITLNCLLGGGGGSDGNAHFSDNFMQCLWLSLEDFDEQRNGPIAAVGGLPYSSANALEHAIFAKEKSGTHIKDLSPALFNSEAVGGANASAGFGGDAASNPWDYILMLEGSLLLAGSAARRYSSTANRETTFPFTVEFTPVGTGSLSNSEKSAMAREVWLPLWSRRLRHSEAKSLFSEAKLSVGKRTAKNGLDVARAIANLGVDRGVEEFQRVALLRGRIGGDNYFTSCNLGRFHVKANPGAEELIAPLDGWLDRFRRAATGKTAPERARRALRRLESSILNLCQRGEPADVQATLIALGEAESSVAISKQMRDGNMGSGISPLPLLSLDWLVKANDGSCEFRLAAALASVTHDSVGPIRRHIEPIDRKTWKTKYPKWASDANDPAIVWSSASLVANLCAVLNRRLIDVMKTGKEEKSNDLLAPLRGRLYATLPDIGTFIRKQTNDDRIETLFKSLCLLEFPQSKEEFASVMKQLRAKQSGRVLPDAAYGLLKLCFLPHKLDDAAIALTPQIIRQAIAGRGYEATRLAGRRLLASGFEPAAEYTVVSQEQMRRTAAALLFPISKDDAARLSRRVLRSVDESDKREEDALAAR